MFNTALQEKDPETGEATGSLSTSRILSWVFALFSGILLLAEIVVAIFGEFSDKCDGNLFGLRAAIMYSVGLGVVSVGFYLGRAGGLFDRIAGVLTGSGSNS